MERAVKLRSHREKREISICGALFQLLCLILSLIACSPKRAVLKEPLDSYQVRYYKKTAFDSYGYPKFLNEVKNRDSITGTPYVITLSKDGYVHRYYFITPDTDGDSPNMKKPFRVIYQWTGKGFEIGYEKSKKLISGSVSAGETTARAGGNSYCVSIMALPGIVAGTTIFLASGVIGFIVGVEQAIPATIEEVAKLKMREKELIYGSVIMKYDSEMRLMEYIDLSPPPDELELSKTRFYYDRGKKIPYKSANYSTGEKKERVIYHE